ncbi:MAG: MobV family relaxase [Bacilli bacterium]|nr:MobV family relaxase [Bacilli bacterium]
MNLNYAIFRSEPIYTIKDLAQIGSHNKREKKAYNSNPDIKLELTKNNIELVPLTEKYVMGFYNLTEEYKKEHEERMKTEREDRKKTFKQMLDKSNNVIADELLFTATNDFFKNMTREDIKAWADTCMEFVYNDLGYKKEQILHATVHMDEKTPHIHCVVVPLVKKYDKRTQTERYTISKKQYIKDKIHLSELQDKYHKRLTDKGYDLERGIKGSDNKHVEIKEYKKINKSLEQKINIRTDNLNKQINELDERMKTSKSLPFDKKHIIVDKETFESMNKVIDESKKIKEIEPKIKTLFEEINTFSANYKTLEKENQKFKKEVNKLEKDNNKLEKENNSLIYQISQLFELLKKFLRKLLLRGNEYTKEETSNIVKECYDNEDFEMIDVVHISRGTTKQEELFDYVNAPDYYKEDISHHDKEDYDLSR